MKTRSALLFLTLAAAGACALALSLAGTAAVRAPVPWATLAFSRPEVAGGGVYVGGGGRTRLVVPAAVDPDWSPDGRRLLYLASGAGEAADVFVGDADGGNRGRLTSTLAEESSPDWAPDGRRLVVERDGRIVVLRSDGVEVRTVGRGADPAWSPGGRRIAFVAGGDLWTVSDRGGRPLRVTDTPATESSPAWAPDARRLAYVTDEAGSDDIRVLDLRSGQATQLTTDPAAESAPAFSTNGTRVFFVAEQATGELLMTVPSRGGLATPVAGGQLADRPAARPAAQVVELLPDFDQQAPSDLDVRRSRGRSLLWFTSAADNVGLGPFIVNGRRAGGVMRANQRVRLAAGTFRTYPRVGAWRYNTSVDHSHWHLVGFQRYELRRGDGSVVVRDRKSGFCIGDRYGIAPGRIAGRAGRPFFRGFCNRYEPAATQVDAGTSVGFSDRYHSRLDGQNLDITRIPAGRYVVVNRANPTMAVHELRYENNAASVAIRITRRRGAGPEVKILATCPDSIRC